MSRPAADAATVAAALSELLSSDGVDAQVAVTGIASAGAVRNTLFLDLDRKGQKSAAVAQIGTPDRTATRSMTTVDEAAMLDLARDVGIPTPVVLAASDHFTSLGASVMVTEAVDGETIPRRVLRVLDTHPGAGENLAAECGTAMARLHSVNPRLAPPSVSQLDHADPAVAYIDTLSDWLDGLEDPHPVLRYGINELGDTIPTAPPAVAVVHGDLRLGNLIVGPNATDQNANWLRAVIDWELAHIGDPMEDLAWLCLRTWRFGRDPAVGGFAALSVLRDAYEQAGGMWRQAAFDWWTLARTIWWGIGLASQAANFANGASTSIVHAASGRRVVELEYDLLRLIGDRRGF